jgi:hypothetical protein
VIPTFHFVEIDQTDTASKTAADRENSSRIAVVEVQQQSKGIGQHRLPKPIVFPVIFRDEPHFTYGSAVVSRIHDGLYHDPRGCSGVYAWTRDKRGYYTGALCWVRVDIEAIAGGLAGATSIANLTSSARQKKAATAARYKAQSAATSAGQGVTNLSKVVVEHYFTFSAVAIKDLPTQDLSKALNPRTIGI